MGNLLLKHYIFAIVVGAGLFLLDLILQGPGFTNGLTRFEFATWVLGFNALFSGNIEITNLLGYIRVLLLVLLIGHTLLTIFNPQKSN